MHKTAKIFIIALLVFVTSVTTHAAEGEIYKDVNGQHRYYDSISEITRQGIVSGYEDGSYRPEAKVNRAELLRIINEAFSQVEEEPWTNENCFIDVPARQWFTHYTCFSKSLGYVEGYPDGTFRPAQTVSLMEALKIVMEIYGLEEYENYKTKSGFAKFWYEPVLKAALDGDLIPRDFATLHDPVNRGQMAEIIVRVQNFYEEKADPDDFSPLNKRQYLPNAIYLGVPFTSQAPYGNWQAPYNEACEEAALLMVNFYYSEKILNNEIAAGEIVKLTGWEEEQGYIIDIDSAEMAEISLNYHGRHSKVYYDEDVTIENIKRLLAAGYPVIVPVAGREIGNVNYIQPAPLYHVLVITGYDQNRFFTNDPGTQFGYRYAYSQEVLFNGIHDWAGSKESILQGRKAMIVLER